MLLSTRTHKIFYSLYLSSFDSQSDGDKKGLSCYWTQVACPFSFLSKLGWHCCYLSMVWNGLSVGHRWQSVDSQGMRLALLFLHGFMDINTPAIVTIKLTTQKKLWFTRLYPGSGSFGFWSNTHSLVAGCPDLFNVWVSSLQKHVSFQMNELGWICNKVISKN